MVEDVSSSIVFMSDIINLIVANLLKTKGKKSSFYGRS